MTSLTEGLLRLDFPLGWRAEKYDKTGHYIHHVQSLAESKAVDIVALSPAPNACIWLIEVKDYRAHPRVKDLDFFDEIASKVRDSLAGLLLAQQRPEAGTLHTLSMALSHDVKLRVAVHLEQTHKPSKLRPAVTDRANHRMKLRQVLRAVDTKAEICERSLMPPTVLWAVT